LFFQVFFVYFADGLFHGEKGLSVRSPNSIDEMERRYSYKRSPYEAPEAEAVEVVESWSLLQYPVMPQNDPGVEDDYGEF
jgi:hypothetical protein